MDIKALTHPPLPPQLLVPPHPADPIVLDDSDSDSDLPSVTLAPIAYRVRTSDEESESHVTRNYTSSSELSSIESSQLASSEDDSDAGYTSGWRRASYDAKRKRDSGYPDMLSQEIQDGRTNGIHPEEKDKQAEDNLFSDETTLSELMAQNSDSVYGNGDIKTDDLRKRHRLEKDKRRLNRRDASGRTVLFESITRNSHSLVKRLLAAGVEVNVKDDLAWTPLHEACIYGNVDVVETLLDHGAAVNAPGGPSNDTPLHDAAKRGWLDVTQQLLNAGADPLFRNDEGETPFDVVKEPTSELGQVLQKQAQVMKLTRVKDRSGRTLLHLAASQNKFRDVLNLLHGGSDVHARDNAGWTPLHEAALEGRVEILQLLLAWGSDPNSRGFHGDTPLHDAAENGHVKVVKNLVEAGADMTLRNEQGKRPLDVATHEGVRTYLSVKMGLEPKSSDKGNQALQGLFHSDSDSSLEKNDTASARKRRRGRPRKPTELELDPTVVIPSYSESDEEDEVDPRPRQRPRTIHSSPIRASVHSPGTPTSREDRKLQQLMVTLNRIEEREEKKKRRKQYEYYDRPPRSGGRGRARGGRRTTNRDAHSDEDDKESNHHRIIPATSVMRPRKRDKTGRTPLHRAAEKGESQLLLTMIEEGKAMPTENKEVLELYNVNSRDNGGWTPLHSAALKGHLDCCRILLDSGANPKARAENGDTALHDAAENGHDEVCRLLVKAGANRNAKNASGQRPADLWEGDDDNVLALLADELEGPPVPEPSVAPSKPKKATPTRAVTTDKPKPAKRGPGRPPKSRASAPSPALSARKKRRLLSRKEVAIESSNDEEEPPKTTKTTKKLPPTPVVSNTSSPVVNGEVLSPLPSPRIVRSSECVNNLARYFVPLYALNLHPEYLQVGSPTSFGHARQASTSSWIAYVSDFQLRLLFDLPHPSFLKREYDGFSAAMGDPIYTIFQSNMVRRSPVHHARERLWEPVEIMLSRWRERHQSLALAPYDATKSTTLLSWSNCLDRNTFLACEMWLLRLDQVTEVVRRLYPSLLARLTSITLDMGLYEEETSPIHKSTETKQSFALPAKLAMKFKNRAISEGQHQ